MKKILTLLLLALSVTTFAQSDKLVRRITYELGKIEGSLPQINILMKKGEKMQAREMVDDALKQLEQIETDQKEAALMDATLTEEDLFIPQTQETKRLLISKANRLKNSIGIYINCKAQLFEKDYTLYKDALQGQLTDINCSFVEGKEQADWVIEIIASSREGAKMTTGNFTTYFSYVDLKLSIDKSSNGKRIYQNAFSEKGADSRNFEYAAIEAYKDLFSQISAIIKEQIQL